MVRPAGVLHHYEQAEVSRTQAPAERMDHAPHVQHFTVLNRLVFLFVIRLEGLLSSPCRVVLVSAV